MKHLDPERWRRMIHSRDITELLPTVRAMCAHFLTECTTRGIDVMITSTFRDQEAQAELWRHGRENSDRIVTRCPPNWSWHQWRCAFDVSVLRHGKPIHAQFCDPAELDLWQRVGECGELAGLVWGGRLDGVDQELGHFEHTYGRDIVDVNRGVGLPETLDGHVVRFSGNGAAERGWRSFISSWVVPPKVKALFTNGAGHHEG